MRSASSGMASDAGTTSTRTGSPVRMRRNASWLAWSIVLNGLPSRKTSSAAELFEKAGKLWISAGWRAPAHMRNLGVLTGQIGGEYLESDVDHARRCCEKIARNIVVLFGHCSRFQSIWSPCTDAKYSVNMHVPGVGPVQFRWADTTGARRGKSCGGLV